MRESGIGRLPCLPRPHPPARPHAPSRDSMPTTTGSGCLLPGTPHPVLVSPKPPAPSAALRRPGMPRYRRPPLTPKRPPQAVGTHPGVNHGAWLKRCPRCATQAGAHPPPSSGRHHPGSPSVAHRRWNTAQDTASRRHRQQEDYIPDPGGYRGKKTPAKSKTSSAARGLGYEHRRNRERMLRNHIDGKSCRCGVGTDCGPGCICRRAGYALPTYRNPALNPDGLPLTADPSIARSRGGLKADRLVLAAYNRCRGAGDRGDRHAAPWRAREWTGGGQLAC
jgi:hypothetical protein